MMLNPESEYFKAHMQREDSYFRRIQHINLGEIEDYIAKFYTIERRGYFLGIRRQQVFDTTDKKLASLYVIVGRKKQK